MIHFHLAEIPLDYDGHPTSPEDDDPSAEDLSAEDLSAEDSSAEDSSVRERSEAATTHSSGRGMQFSQLIIDC